MASSINASALSKSPCCLYSMTRSLMVPSVPDVGTGPRSHPRSPSLLQFAKCSRDQRTEQTGNNIYDHCHSHLVIPTSMITGVPPVTLISVCDRPTTPVHHFVMRHSCLSFRIVQSLFICASGIDTVLVKASGPDFYTIRAGNVDAVFEIASMFIIVS